MLRQDAAILARQLLPEGSIQGGEWKCSASNSPTGSPISVCIAGKKKGLCGFWDSEKGGDMLDLIETVEGLTKKGAVDWAKVWLGIDGGVPATRQNLQAKRVKAQQSIQRREVDSAEQERRNIAYAQKIWKETVPLSGAAASYLRHRGLDPTFAEDLRLATSLKHPEGGNFPALVGRVQDVAGKGIGVWRIFVKINGDGKAPVDNPKMGLGKFIGGAVRIGGVDTEIGIAEGFETAIACRQLVSLLVGKRMPVWATLSAAGMAALELPEQISAVRVYADADTEKMRGGIIRPSPGLKAANELADKYRQRGVRVIIERPPTDMDWLDVLNSKVIRAA